MRRDESCDLRAFRENALGALIESRAEKAVTDEFFQEAAERLLLIHECRFHAQEFPIDVRDRAYRQAFVAVEHVAFNASEIIHGVVDSVAHRGVEMREEYLQQDVGRDGILSADEFLGLKKLLEMVERGDDLIAHGYDEIFTDDKIHFLILRIAVFNPVGREMEHEKRRPAFLRDHRRRGRGNHLFLELLADGKLLYDGAYLFFSWLFKVDPYAAAVCMSRYHESRIPYRPRAAALPKAGTTRYTLLMEGAQNAGRRTVTRGISFALVAALAFGVGLFVGDSGSAATVVARIPLIGDGLDATPDQSADLTDFWKAWNALNANYVNTHASSTRPSVEERVLGAIEGLTSSYNDPYTVFFPPKEAKAFAEAISGSFAGVGMEIDVKDGIVTVVAPLKGTPAERAGVKAGDQIAAIDGKSTDGVSVDKAVSQIRGPVGTTVDLTIIRGGKPLDIKIIRETIQIPETEDGIDEASGVYHIALYEFTSNSANLFDQAFARFLASGSRKLIIDLRGNPGGYLDAAVDIASHFLGRGAKVVIEDFGGKEQDNVHTSFGYADLPAGTKVAVLIDGGSASASEIFAGALQDNRAATVIGTRSFGKGSVQTLFDLAGGSLKITVARWVTPEGHSIMGNGITPDIIVPFTAADAAAKKDPQMARAIEFLTTGK